MLLLFYILRTQYVILMQIGQFFKPVNGLTWTGEGYEERYFYDEREWRQTPVFKGGYRPQLTREEFLNKEFIEREVEASDRDRYQTIYAEHVGAVAAPTAGLHFTKHLLKRLEIKGVSVSPITLHIGLGTFRQVDVEDLTKHKMDSENYDIPQQTVELVNKALDNKKMVVSVGTTALKTIESSVTANGRLKASSGWTDRFIIPPYEFKIANSLITNFHLPESTLLMTTSAFGGYDLIMKAYQEAIKEKYKFFSYGDAMLIL